MKRTQFYLSKLYDTQLKRKQDYSDLQKAIVINILCGDKFELPKDQWHNVYIFKEKTKNTPMCDGMLELHFIELDKMEKLGNFDEYDALTRWVLFMNAESMRDMKTVAKQDPAICKAYTIVEELARNKQEREAYEAREKFLLDQLTRERSAEEEGRRKGRIEGLKEGLKEGKIEGLKEGLKEGKVETARAMLAAGIPIETICQITGLDTQDFKSE
jgi:predicted transposase/invertase (TIGR01784 family)